MIEAGAGAVTLSATIGNCITRHGSSTLLTPLQLLQHLCNFRAKHPNHNHSLFTLEHTMMYAVHDTCTVLCISTCVCLQGPRATCCSLSLASFFSSIASFQCSTNKLVETEAYELGKPHFCFILLTIRKILGR